MKPKHTIAGVRVTPDSLDRAAAIAAATGAHRAGVLKRAVELGLEQLSRQVSLTPR